MAAPASGKKKKQKGKTLNLNDFLADDKGGVSTTVTVKPVSWADEMENNEYDELDEVAYKVSLPTAPRAARGPDVDLARVPTEPPFTAFMGNLPFDVDEIEIERFFNGLRIENIRFPPGKSKGFGYCDFEDRESLIEALNLNNESVRNRKVRIDLADQHQNNERNDRREGGWKARDDDDDRTMGDWRRRGPDDNDRDSGRDRYNDRGGDRDRGGFGNRDRGYGGDRDSDRYGGDRDRGSYGRSGGFGNRDRYGDRDRGGFGDRDRSFGDRDRGYGGDRDRGSFGDRDRGYGDRDRGGFGRDRDRGGFGDRDRGSGGGFDRDRGSGGGFDRDRGSGGGFGDRDRGGGGGFDRDRRGGFGDRDRDRDGGRRAFGSGFRNDDDRDRDGYGPPRERREGDSSFERGREDRDGPRERPRLNLQPRTKPVEESAGPGPAAPPDSGKKAGSDSGRAASIFGSAKPVDTAAKEREIEERLNRQREQERDRIDQEREKRLSDEHDRRRDGRYDERSEVLSSSNSDRGGRTRSDSGSEVNGPTERRRERKSSSSSGKNMRTVAPPPTAGSARVRRDSALSGDEDVFDDGRSSKPTTPKDKEPPAKLVPAPVPKENVWQRRKEVQKQTQPQSPPSSAGSNAGPPAHSQTTPPKHKESRAQTNQQQQQQQQPKLQPQWKKGTPGVLFLNNPSSLHKETPRPKENPWNRGSRPAEKTPPKNTTVSINDPPKENVNPAPAPKENAWSKKPDIAPHKNSVVVSVADPPKSDNVWARRKAEQGQRDKNGDDGGFAGSHWGKSRGDRGDVGRGEGPRPGGGRGGPPGGRGGPPGGRGGGGGGGPGGRSGTNDRGFGRGRGGPAEKRERHERPLPKSIDEMPKLQEHSNKDWSTTNVFSNLADEEEGASDQEE